MGIDRSVRNLSILVVIMHRAGWHVAADLNVPTTSRRSAGPAPPSLLPPYSPELNAIERVGLYLRERFLSHRVWRTYADIVDARCQAWNALVDGDRPHPLPLFARLGPAGQKLTWAALY
jgi:transposase